MEERTLLVGIDLGSEFTQISCFDFTTYEPKPIGRRIGNDERQYEIPTGLSVDFNQNEWYWIGEAKGKHAQSIRNPFAKLEKKDNDTSDVDMYQVCKRFIVKILSLLKEEYPNDKIRKLVISVAKKQDILCDTLKRICLELGMPENTLIIQNHRQSYMYYAISQSKELWNNNVGLFELDKNGLIYSQIDIDRKTKPYIIGVSSKDLSDAIDWDELEERDEYDMSYAFVNAANTALYKQMVTTVYATGSGLQGEWANDALKELCSGRHVFRGQNLFTKGACYAARELSGQGKLQDCLLLDEEMLSSNVSIRTYHDAQLQDVLLAKAGTLWNEVDASIDVIPDDEDEIQITIQDVLRHETKAHMLSLSGFSGRENRMTRFTIRIRFADKNTCIVTLKDNGFGEYCPSSNRIWERYIKIE